MTTVMRSDPLATQKTQLQPIFDTNYHDIAHASMRPIIVALRHRYLNNCHFFGNFTFGAFGI